MHTHNTEYWNADITACLVHTRATDLSAGSISDFAPCSDFEQHACIHVRTDVFPKNCREKPLIECKIVKNRQICSRTRSNATRRVASLNIAQILDPDSDVVIQFDAEFRAIAVRRHIVKAKAAKHSGRARVGRLRRDEFELAVIRADQIETACCDAASDTKLTELGYDEKASGVQHFARFDLVLAKVAFEIVSALDVHLREQPKSSDVRQQQLWFAHSGQVFGQRNIRALCNGIAVGSLPQNECASLC